jgi:nitrite reductase (NADH) small subunit
MAKQVRLCSIAELPPEGEAREMTAGSQTLCVANLRGEVSVLDNACPHRGGPLGQGVLENGTVVCPWHAWAFDLKTGCATHNPQARVPVYPVHVAGSDVLVELPDADANP